MTKTLRSIADLRPDPHNANEGRKRGLDLLERSLERCGAGRSIVVDRHGMVIAGNKTLERAADQGFEIDVIQSDGRKLIVVQRTDLDLTSETDARARELAIADNRVSEVDLSWDAEALLHQHPGVDLGGYFFDAELARLCGEADEKGELGTPKPTVEKTAAAAKADSEVEPDASQASAHDPADENQTICPECGARF